MTLITLNLWVMCFEKVPHTLVTTFCSLLEINEVVYLVKASCFLLFMGQTKPTEHKDLLVHCTSTTVL